MIFRLRLEADHVQLKRETCPFISRGRTQENARNGRGRLPTNGRTACRQIWEIRVAQMNLRAVAYTTVCFRKRREKKGF